MNWLSSPNNCILLLSMWYKDRQSSFSVCLFLDRIDGQRICEAYIRLFFSLGRHWWLQNETKYIGQIFLDVIDQYNVGILTWSIVINFEEWNPMSRWHTSVVEDSLSRYTISSLRFPLYRYILHLSFCCCISYLSLSSLFDSYCLAIYPTIVPCTRRKTFLHISIVHQRNVIDIRLCSLRLPLQMVWIDK